MKLRAKFCSSLAKVMPQVEPELEIRHGCTLRGERFSFQLAYRADRPTRLMLEVKSSSSFGERLLIRKVGLVPVEFTGTEWDDDVISKEPGMYPDLLMPLRPEENWAPLIPSWRSLWFTVDVPQDFVPGRYKITVVLRGFWPFEENRKYFDFGTRTFYLQVLDAVIPPQTLINSHWFYADCLATYYKVSVFSEVHWRIIGNFMRNAAKHGINMILTPVFTPPLDTQIGAERPTVQLIDVYRENGKYRFNFAKLKRWIGLALENGIQYFEISHLFTQWGAYCTPKIVAMENGEYKRIFGWDVNALSQEYSDFLDVFLPQLKVFLKENNLEKNTFFHCSDEPEPKHLANYLEAKRLLDKHLKDYPVIDALSDVKFYTRRIVMNPVPGEGCLDKFIEAGLKNPWTYYCCGPATRFSNRFIHMPSSRNRILGALLYLYDVKGFLHWGYNFYYSGLSRSEIDPYRCNDAGIFFPAGDGFVVYPGPNGEPEDSIRHEVFFEALQDQRVLQKLESCIGRRAVEKLLHRYSPGGNMKMDCYPVGEKAFWHLRSKINEMVAKYVSASK